MIRGAGYSPVKVIFIFGQVVDLLCGFQERVNCNVCDRSRSSDQDVGG